MSVDYGTITSTQEDLNGLGMYTGTGDIMIAMLQTEDTKTTPPAYYPPIVAAEGVDIGLTPTQAAGQASGSNHQICKQNQLIGMNVAAQLARIKADVLGMLMARVTDANGGQSSGDGKKPICAVGVTATRDDGTELMRWIYKCTASESNVTMHTEEEGSINYQMPTINFDGVKTIYETTGANGKPVRLVQYIADTADAKCKWTHETFFAEVRGPWTPMQEG